MKIFFISPFCLLRPTTNRIFDMRFCDLLAGAGTDVTLIHPYYFMKENLREEELVKNYGVMHPLKFSMLKTPLNDRSMHWLQLVVLLTAFFFRSIRIIYSNRKNLEDVYIISRDNKSSLPMMMLKKILGRRCPLKIITTVHEVKNGTLNRWMYRNYNGILVTTSSAKQKLVNDIHVLPAKIERLISSVPDVNYSSGKEDARKRIQYNEQKPLVAYTGKLGKGIKELDYILDAAVLLPQYNFILTGGKQEAVDYFKELCKKRNIQNLILPGFINDSSFISYYQLAADVLVSYYTELDHVVEYNFPQKLVEYMHSRNPIVTPDFPATHDVINASNAVIVEPDNPSSLAQGIKTAVEQKDRSKALAERAFEDVKKFSDESGAENLIEFLIKLKPAL